MAELRRDGVWANPPLRPLSLQLGTSLLGKNTTQHNTQIIVADAPPSVEGGVIAVRVSSDVSGTS